MQSYLHLLDFVLTNGVAKTDRTGVGTRSCFGEQLNIDLTKGFPLLTTKKLHTRSIVHELLWIIKGETNIQYLHDNKVTIWDEWADSNGNLGPVYGKQWRQWEGKNRTVDQLAEVIEQLKTNPHSRRLIVNAWNVGDIPDMKLPPCHMMFQFYVDDNQNLSCQLYQRSADIFLGVPFNIASYALLTHMVAQVTQLKAHRLIMTFGDIHLYNNHIEQAKLQLTRQPLTLPSLVLNPAITDINHFTFQDISLNHYQSHPAIKAEVAI